MRASCSSSHHKLIQWYHCISGTTVPVPLYPHKLIQWYRFGIQTLNPRPPLADTVVPLRYSSRAMFPLFKFQTPFMDAGMIPHASKPLNPRPWILNTKGYLGRHVCVPRIPIRGHTAFVIIKPASTPPSKRVEAPPASSHGSIEVRGHAHHALPGRTGQRSSSPRVRVGCGMSHGRATHLLGPVRRGVQGLVDGRAGEKW